MKAKKLFWTLAAAFAALSMSVAFSSCEKQEPTPSGDDDDEDEEIIREAIPNVSNPSNEETTLLFRIVDATCEDFSLSLQGYSGKWEANADNEYVFSRVEGTTQWFQITVPAMDETQENFKIRANSSWTYEPKSGYELLESTSDYVAAGSASGDDAGNINNLHITKAAGGQVLYIDVIEFVTPCVKPQDYTITLKTTYCGAEGTDVAITGNITGADWGTATPMQKIDETTYTFEVKDGMAGMEFKFQSTEGGWANQPLEWVVDDKNPEGAWNGGLSNFKLGKETKITIDLTDSKKYVWGYCKE